jgi:hypothetical protein
MQRREVAKLCCFTLIMSLSAVSLAGYVSTRTPTLTKMLGKWMFMIFYIFWLSNSLIYMPLTHVQCPNPTYAHLTTNQRDVKFVAGTLYSEFYTKRLRIGYDSHTLVANQYETVTIQYKMWRIVYETDRKCYELTCYVTRYLRLSGRVYEDFKTFCDIYELIART